ncbi:MAG: hypothetical protein [Bacteriophage sp.]|nr:MAG: hypothetical protein [Bacteriophage sp.]
MINSIESICANELGEVSCHFNGMREAISLDKEILDNPEFLYKNGFSWSWSVSSNQEVLRIANPKMGVTSKEFLNSLSKANLLNKSNYWEELIN